MALPHGQAIAGEEFELEVGRALTVERFASLCNAIAWCIGQVKGLAQLSFTERVNVADNGIDADWTLELPKNDQCTTPIVGPGWNVFQYKKRDITTQDRRMTITALVGNLKGALKQIVDKVDRVPDQYVLFTNIHLTKNDKQRLANSIEKSHNKEESAKILIFGAAEIAAFVNDLPHLRSGYFATNNFQTWPMAWDAHNRHRMAGGNVELTGRMTFLGELKAAVDDSKVRVIVVSGAHQLGKSRIVLEAARHRELETVVALDPLSIDVADLFGLRRNNEDVIVIVDDLDSGTAVQLANAVMGQQGIKLILTVPTSDPMFVESDRATQQYGWAEQTSANVYLLKNNQLEFWRSLSSNRMESKAEVA